MPTHVNTRWFKEKLDEKKLSQRSLAKRLGIDPSAVSLMLRGKRDIRLEEAIELSKILGLPRDDVLAQVGLDLSTLNPAGDKLKVIGWVDTDGAVHPGTVQGPGYVPAPPGVPEGTVAIRYQTNDVRDGWLAYFKPVEYVQPEAIGRYAVVTALDGKMAIRILKHGYEPGIYRMSRLAMADGVGESGQILAASPVLWLRQ